MALKVCGAGHSVPATAVAVDYLPYLHGAPPSNYIFDGDVKAALFLASGAQTNSVITPPGYLGVGMSDGTNHAEVSIGGTDGGSTTNWRMRLRNSACTGFADTATGSQLFSATGAIVQNGFRLNYTQGNATSYLVNALLFGGSGVEAQVLTTSFVGGAAETKHVTHSLSGNPDLLYAISSNGTVNAFGGLGRISLGAYARAANSSVAMAATHLFPVTPENIGQVLLNTALLAQVTNAGTVDYLVTAGNFTSTAFDLFTSADAGTDAISLLLLKFPNSYVQTGTIALPTNGTEFPAITGMTKRPKAVLVFPTILTAVNTPATNDNAGFMGIGAAWENNGYPEQFSVGVLTDDAATTMNNKSMSAGLLMQVPTLTGSPVTQLLARLSTFNDDGANIMMSTPDVTVRQAGYIAFGDTAPAPVVNLVSTLTPGQTFSISLANGTATGNAVTVGGVTQPIVTQSTTSIVCTATLGTNRYLDDLPLVVTNSNSLASAPFAVHFDLDAGVALALMVAPLVPASERVEAVPDTAGGDQLEYGFVVGGLLSDLLINSDGSIETLNTSLASFKCRLHDGTGWSAQALDGSDWTTILLSIVVITPQAIKVVISLGPPT